MPFEAKEEKKKVEFTHVLDGDIGWATTHILNDLIKEVRCIHYLGNCNTDGDMFAVYHNSGDICIYKGHLNSGEY